MKRWIHAAKCNGFYASEFDNQQIYQIRKGLESGIDVSQYADPKLSWEQMQEIREGLEKVRL